MASDGPPYSRPGGGLSIGVVLVDRSCSDWHLQFRSAGSRASSLPLSDLQVLGIDAIGLRLLFSLEGGGDFRPSQSMNETNKTSESGSSPEAGTRDFRSCVPYGYLEGFHRFLHRYRDQIQIHTYADLPFKDDWNYECGYAEEWKRWKRWVKSDADASSKVHLILQHDVDDLPNRTHEMLRLQMDLGIRSNVFIFRKSIRRRLLDRDGILEERTYDLDHGLLGRCESGGWVVGYHSNAYEWAKFDLVKARQIFEEDVAALRDRYDVRFFCPHGGVRDNEGNSNAILPLPESLRKKIRWVLNGHSISLSGSWSDGGLNGKRDPEGRDLRDFVRTWKPGGRYRILIHPQYYGEIWKRSKRLTGTSWYEESINCEESGRDPWASVEMPAVIQQATRKGRSVGRLSDPTVQRRESRPIFIGGDGRSGTTLLNVVLDSHPDLSVAPEYHFSGCPNAGSAALAALDVADPRSGWSPLSWLRDRLQGRNSESRPLVAEQFVHRSLRAGHRPDEIRACVRRAMKELGRDLDDFPSKCHLIDLLGRNLAKRSGSSRWGCKIMREIRKPQRYLEQWPRASFLHIIRDGRDVAASQMSEHSGWGYLDIAEAASKWKSIIGMARENARKHGVPVLEVRYEDLIQNNEATLRRIMEFLDEPWSDRLLRHEEAEHDFFRTTVSHPSRARTQQPLDASAIGRYRRDLDADQAREFESIAGEMLESLGYEVGE